MRVATKYLNLTRGFFCRARSSRLPHRREFRRDRGRAGGGLGRTDRRHHHHRHDARRQRAEGGGRRRHPALAGQSGRGAHRVLGRGRARDGAPHPRSHRGAGARPRLSRGAHALSAAATMRCWRRPGSVSASSAPFGGPTSSGMLTLHCPPQPHLRSRELHARARRGEHRRRRNRIRVRARQSALRAARRRSLRRGLISTQPWPDRRKLNESKVVRRQLAVACCDPPVLLDLVEAPLDQVAPSIEVRAEADRIAAAAPRWNIGSASFRTARPLQDTDLTRYADRT